jgi:hypothetical protein
LPASLHIIKSSPLSRKSSGDREIRLFIVYFVRKMT